MGSGESNHRETNDVLPSNCYTPEREHSTDHNNPHGPASSYSSQHATQNKETPSVDPLETLRTLTSEDCYYSAWNLMNRLPNKNLNDFLEFLGTLVVHLQQKQLRQAASQPLRPPAPALKPVKAFLIVTGKTHGADQQLLEQLNAQGSKVAPTDDLQQSDVILLFCPVVSRVGSDVEGAVRKIPEGAQGKPVVLVLMHHTRKPDEILDRTEWGEVYPCISLDVRVLFHQTTNGLLQCPRNQGAVQTLRSLCERFTKENKSGPRVPTKAAEGTSDMNLD